MKTILVTGAAGYVGSVLVGKLLSKNYQVKGLDMFLYDPNSLDNYSRMKNLEIIRGDIRNESIIKDVMRGTDVVVHLASISNDPTAELDESITKSVNYDAYDILLGMAKHLGVKRFINASSSSVFGIKNEENITEELTPEPITIYSKYKAMSEKLVNAASSRAFTTVNIRPATICGYSPRQRFDLTVNILTKDAITKGKMVVHGGEQMRPNVTMSDITDLYIKMIEIESEYINGDTFNYGFENLKVIEIARLIQSALSIPSEIEIQPIIDQRNYHISSRKIEEKLGITPLYSIVDMVRKLEEAFHNGLFPNPNDDKYYNLKKMRLEDFN